MASTNGNGKRGRHKEPTGLTGSDDRVLMTFQVDGALRTAANEKAHATSINLSQFLRQCVYEFTYSEEIGRATKQLQKSVTKNALASSIKTN
jgi:hypothetical protein